MEFRSWMAIFLLSIIALWFIGILVLTGLGVTLGTPVIAVSGGLVPILTLIANFYFRKKGDGGKSNWSGE